LKNKSLKVSHGMRRPDRQFNSVDVDVKALYNPVVGYRGRSAHHGVPRNRCVLFYQLQKKSTRRDRDHQLSVRWLTVAAAA
jgi:hypothetical protein